MHCLLRGINIYRILKKLNTFASATAYLECECSKETNPEIDDVKEISYFVFEKKEKCYVKNGKEMVSCRDGFIEFHRDGFIELDFSENISEKPKREVKSAHFSGMQYSLHCSIVESGNEKYVYHISDDTTHDPSFVKSVLEDIF